MRKFEVRRGTISAGPDRRSARRRQIPCSPMRASAVWRAAFSRRRTGALSLTSSASFGLFGWSDAARSDLRDRLLQHLRRPVSSGQCCGCCISPYPAVAAFFAGENARLNLGLAGIIRLSTPVLNAVYPIAIVLIAPRSPPSPRKSVRSGCSRSPCTAVQSVRCPAARACFLARERASALSLSAFDGCCLPPPVWCSDLCSPQSRYKTKDLPLRFVHRCGRSSVIKNCGVFGAVYFQECAAALS